MNRSSTLFALPSFTRGISTILDLGSTLTVYNESRTPAEADSKAIYSDWLAVGDDIIIAIENWESKYGEKEST